jgi:hypothetical protein
VYLVGFAIEIYHDARPYERQKRRTSLNIQYTVGLNYMDQTVNDAEGVGCTSFIIRNT